MSPGRRDLRVAPLVVFCLHFCRLAAHKLGGVCNGAEHIGCPLPLLLTSGDFGGLRSRSFVDN